MSFPAATGGEPTMAPPPETAEDDGVYKTLAERVIPG